MNIRDRVGLDAAERAALEREIADHASLLDVMRWGAARRPNAKGHAHVISSVVVQDEYTHDVVVPLDDKIVLVYDTT